MTDGRDGGYAFTVSIHGSPGIRGFFLKSLSGFVRFPRDLATLPVWLKRRMSAPLRRDLAQIVTTRDARYHPISATADSHGEPPKQPSTGASDEALQIEYLSLKDALDYVTIEDPKERQKATARARELRRLLNIQDDFDY